MSLFGSWPLRDYLVTLVLVEISSLPPPPSFLVISLTQARAIWEEDPQLNLEIASFSLPAGRSVWHLLD